MPRGRPKNKPPVESKESGKESGKELLDTEITRELIGVIKDLKEEVTKLTFQKKEEAEKSETPALKATSEVSSPEAITEADPKYPIPVEYRMIVNQELGKDFGIKVDPAPDRPEFNFTIIVPERLNTLTEDEKKMYGQDLRGKMISYSQGISGVREYVALVKKNLAAKMQEQVR